MRILTGKRGFTLIEMLVVIAIIGILAAVVLAALGPSRAKARDTRIISNVNQVRALAEVWYTGHNNNYTGFVATDPSTNLGTIVSDMASLGSQLNINVDGTGQFYTATGQLASDSTKYYCVDSSGGANQAVTSANPGTKCP